VRIQKLSFNSQVWAHLSVGSAENFHYLGDLPPLILLIAAGDRVFDAMSNVIPQNLLFSTAKGRPDSWNLGHNLDAIAILPAVAGDFMSVREIALVPKNRIGAAGKWVPTMQLPNWLVRLAAMRDPEVRSILPELGKFKNVTNAKAKRPLGWAPRSNEEAIVACGKSGAARIAERRPEEGGVIGEFRPRRSYGAMSLVEMPLNTEFSLLPSAPAPTMIATPIRVAIIPYSIAVAPDSSLVKRWRIVITINVLQVRMNTKWTGPASPKPLHRDRYAL
jgi:hypothetical protein